MADAPTTAPVVWYRSQRFTALCQSTVLFSLGWLVQALTDDRWVWRGLAVAVLGNILLQLKDWWSPNVIGPAPMFNKSLSGSVSVSAIRDAVARQEKKP